LAGCSLSKFASINGLGFFDMMSYFQDVAVTSTPTLPSGPKKLHTVFIAMTLSTLNQFS